MILATESFLVVLSGIQTHNPQPLNLYNTSNNLYIYIHIYKLFKEKNETFHFVKYFGIAFINYIFIQRNTCKIHYIQSFLKLLF